MAMAMERSSPKILCHRFVGEDEAEESMSERMVLRRSRRRAVMVMVPATESMVQPSIFLRVAQVASPLRSFLTETGS